MLRRGVAVAAPLLSWLKNTTKAGGFIKRSLQPLENRVILSEAKNPRPCRFAVGASHHPPETINCQIIILIYPPGGTHTIC